MLRIQGQDGGPAQDRAGARGRDRAGGSVRRAESRLRITVQLINVADGFHLWSSATTREMADVFAIQDEMSRAIAAALMPNLAAERPGMLVKPYTGSVDAYELCLRARYHHQKRTPAGLGMALRLFEQAIARDRCATGARWNRARLPDYVLLRRHADARRHDQNESRGTARSRVGRSAGRRPRPPG
ncbi:MAG: hypothetical protein MZW92_42430 [Comamonadaceae bacterium]|nr:hypothetical protein [Comamonadaceae bacterium]